MLREAAAEREGGEVRDGDGDAEREGGHRGEGQHGVEAQDEQEDGDLRAEFTSSISSRGLARKLLKLQSA